MTTRQLGEIPLEDYLAAVSHSKHRALKRLGLSGLGLLLCFVCIAAGDYYNPWYGDLTDINYDQAITILEQSEPVEWAAEAGMLAAYRHNRKVLDRLLDVAERSERDAENASLYLLHLARRGVRHIADLRSKGVLIQRQEDSLRLLKNDCDK